MNDALKTIRGFTRFYNSLALQWEKNLLQRGHSLQEIRTLFELQIIEVCTLRELASRLHIRVDKMNYVSARLKRAGLVTIKPDDKDWRFDHVLLTTEGKEEAKRFQILYDKSIISTLGEIERNEREELIVYMDSMQTILKK